MKTHQHVLESDVFRLTRTALALSPSLSLARLAPCRSPVVSTSTHHASARLSARLSASCQHLVSTSRRISPLRITSKHHGNIKRGDIIKTPHINTPHKTRSNKPFRYQQVVVKLQHSTFNAYPACARIFVSGTFQGPSFDMSAR
jgi:hypothetical protein